MCEQRFRKKVRDMDCGCGVLRNARSLNKNSAVARLTFIFSRGCEPGL
ncbi:hypothetical protein BRPE64_DCDS07360 (plasmid) [Caballeronia insecticola]|uniref:Uncharacterized protein n=1 Tax=Caballeronia insecticola TaxID=758793 RepID=R4X4W9_9BURK|nr:hypothetical protein BRPE64_DCDS07360 [Caballeronia insecticola]